MTYGRCNNIEVRDPTYVPGCEPKEKTPILDIIRWKPCPPTYIEGKNGQMMYQIEYCYSIGFLKWDYKNEDFYIESVGMRLAEEAPTQEEFNMIIDVANKQRNNEVE
jgi:hypothetical protein